MVCFLFLSPYEPDTPTCSCARLALFEDTFSVGVCTCFSFLFSVALNLQLILNLICSHISALTMIVEVRQQGYMGQPCAPLSWPQMGGKFPALSLCKQFGIIMIASYQELTT